MITTHDVAQQSGAPVATVSHTPNNSVLVSSGTREAVTKAVTQFGYRPNVNAQALAIRVSDTIGVAVMGVSDAFSNALVRAVDMVIQQHQKYVLIDNNYHEAEKERYTTEVLIRQRCNAPIMHSKALSDRGLAEFIDQIPGMVLISRLVPGYVHRCIYLNNISDTEMATRMLLNNGRQRIGYLASSRRIEGDAMRGEGWLTTLKEQGIVAAGSWVGTGSSNMQDGESAIVELLRRNLRLMVVFAHSDNMATGALTVLKDNGIAIPLHLSIIGFDDIPITRYTDPQLTIVRYPIASVMKMATGLVLQGATSTLGLQASYYFMPTSIRRHSVALRQNAAPITNS